MSEIPSSKDGLELGHHIVYYTFWPVVFGGFGSIVATPFLWYFGYMPPITALMMPYIFALGLCAYFGYLGHYVMPSETYRHVRNGDFDE